MTERTQKMTVVAIIGSVRPDNMTAKVLALVADEMKKYPEVQLEIIDPGKIQLATPGQEPDGSVQRLQEIVSKATGVILTTPEYHGSYSSTIKLVIDNLGFPSVLAGKPVALLGVATGQIGAVKALEHLRSVCSHVGSIVLPGPVSVAGVHKLFDEQGRCQDKKAEKRIRALATNLMGYIQKHVCPQHALEETVREE
jgi:FMN reductase